MKVLITGSHGFVGTNLIEILSGEHEIIRWDVRSDVALPDCDAVIHLAGKAHDTRNTTLEEEYFKVNTELTKKMFDAFLISEAKKFIFFSSIKAKDKDTAYAKSKKTAEDYIISHTDITEITDSKTNTTCTHEISCDPLVASDLRSSARHARDDKGLARDDKKVYILRPCMIHGKGVKGNLPLLFDFVKKGLLWPLAAFENKRSYVSMGNVAFVVSELLKKNVESGIYNICDDDSMSTNDVIQLINKALEREAKMLNIPKPIVRFGATGDYVVDNCKIKYALGINHMPIKAEDGLRYTIQEMIEK